jgi:hypothetical protein
MRPNPLIATFTAIFLIVLVLIDSLLQALPKSNKHSNLRGQTVNEDFHEKTAAARFF